MSGRKIILTAQHSTAQHSTAQHSTAQHSTAQHSTGELWTNRLDYNNIYKTPHNATCKHIRTYVFTSGIMRCLFCCINTTLKNIAVDM